MRIAFLLTTLACGGAEREALLLAERLRRRGHAVLLVVLRRPVAEALPVGPLEARHLLIRKNPVSILSGLLKARRILREFRPDLVHSHTFPANLAARLLRATGGGAPLIASIHNIYEGDRIRMLLYRLSEDLCRRSVAVCRAAADRYVALRAVSPEKIRVLSNGIDLGDFLPDPARREATRRAMQAAHAFVWLAAGRIAAAKDYPNLLRAFAHIHASYPSTQLWVAGEGDPREAMRLTSELGLARAVRWLGLRRDLPALLDAADAFVLSSAWEGMPLAVAEAMAMEKPVAATDVGGVRELLGEEGLLAPSGDAVALSRQMLRLMLLTDGQRRDLGARARQRVADGFQIDAKVREWEELYREALRCT